MRIRLIALIIFLAIAGTQLLFAQKSEKRTLPAFSEISLRTRANVHLSQGNDQSVELKGDESRLENIITEVKDGELIIRNKTKSFFIDMITNWKKNPVEIYVTIPQIDGLTLEGPGSIFANDRINAGILNLTISGAGDIRISNLKAEKVSVFISGTGNLYLTGQQTASEFNSVISGLGHINAFDFEANDVNVRISGMGNCCVTANKKLVARISGLGDIHFHGNPEVDSGISGLGGITAEK